jgi:predicted RNase H-like nuclease (RuvC/YqgF family)
MKNSPVNKAIMATQRARDPQIERFEADLRDLDADIEKMKMTGDCTREKLAALQQRRTMGEEELLEMAEGLERVQELLLNPTRWP